MNSPSDLLAQLAEAEHETSASTRAARKCILIDALGAAARESDTPLEPLAAHLGDPDGYDDGAYDSYWESAAQHACDALVSLGARAVPAIVAQLARTTVSGRMLAALALERIRVSSAAAELERYADDPSPQVCGAVGSALGALVPEGEARAGLVARLLAAPATQSAGLVASGALTRAQQTVLLDRFVALLADPVNEVRVLAANRLGALGADADRAAAALVAHITDPALPVQREVLRALESVGRDDAVTAQAILAATSDADPRIAYDAICALAKRPTALLLPFVPRMLDSLHDGANVHRDEWARVMQSLGPDAPPEVVSALLARLASLQPQMEREHHLIIGALGAMGRAAIPARSALGVLASTHPLAAVRRRASDSLARLP